MIFCILWERHKYDSVFIKNCCFLLNHVNRKTRCKSKQTTRVAKRQNKGHKVIFLFFLFGFEVEIKEWVQIFRSSISKFEEGKKDFTIKVKNDKMGQDQGTISFIIMAQPTTIHLVKYYILWPMITHQYDSDLKKFNPEML